MVGIHPLRPLSTSPRRSLQPHLDLAPSTSEAPHWTTPHATCHPSNITRRRLRSAQYVYASPNLVQTRPSARGKSTGQGPGPGQGHRLHMQRGQRVEPLRGWHTPHSRPSRPSRAAGIPQPIKQGRCSTRAGVGVHQGPQPAQHSPGCAVFQMRGIDKSYDSSNSYNDIAEHGLCRSPKV